MRKDLIFFLLGIVLDFIKIDNDYAFFVNLSTAICFGLAFNCFLYSKSE
jgi:hypothetical protein